jgi:hypothetical protein
VGVSPATFGILPNVFGIVVRGETPQKAGRMPSLPETKDGSRRPQSVNAACQAQEIRTSAMQDLYLLGRTRRRKPRQSGLALVGRI